MVDVGTKRNRVSLSSLCWHFEMLGKTEHHRGGNTGSSAHRQSQLHSMMAHFAISVMTKYGVFTIGCFNISNQHRQINVSKFLSTLIIPFDIHAVQYIMQTF